MPLTQVQNPEKQTADFFVMSSNLQVGRIYRQSNAKTPETEWLWALNGVYGGPKSMRIAGMAATLGQAQSELQASWEAWMAWAGLQDANAPTSIADAPSSAPSI
jgi:hypothetical protein